MIAIVYIYFKIIVICWFSRIYIIFIREKNSLHHTVEKLQAELKQLREQCKELHDSRADVMTELFELKQCCQIELNDAQVDLLNEMINGDSIDDRLSQLRAEVSNLYCIDCTNSVNSLY